MMTTHVMTAPAAGIGEQKRREHEERQHLLATLRYEGLPTPEEAELSALVAHVHVHKYLINRSIGWTISWEDAIFSWYENVLVPVQRTLNLWEVRMAFPRMSFWQMYTAISSHWYFLKERDPNVSAEQAALTFSAQYGSGLGSWFSRFLQPTR